MMLAHCFPADQREGRAYPKKYLDEAMWNTGDCFVCMQDEYPESDILSVISQFMDSPIRALMDIGHPHWVTLSGRDLLIEFTEQTRIKAAPSAGAIKKDVLLWMGLVYSYYQWYVDCTSHSLIQTLPANMLARYYYPWHEVSVHGFVERLLEHET